MPRIACFGEALIDFLAVPGPSATAPMSFLRQAGGAPANVAVAAATLGADAAFIGMLGADLFGDFLAESLARAGVDTGWVRRTSDAKTALAFVSLDARGERSFSFYRPPAADLLYSEDDVAAIDFAAVAVFHVCSNSLTDPAIARATLAGLRRARAAGALVSVDINWRPMLWPVGADPLPVLWSVLAEADVVKASAEELALLVAHEGGGDEAVLARLWAGPTQWLIVTDGAAPVRWHARQASGSSPVYTTTVVDSTAAGDAFVGGLLTQLAAERVSPGFLAAFVADDTRRTAALRFAAACGALAVTRRGAFDAMPTRAEVEALLATADLRGIP